MDDGDGSVKPASFLVHARTGATQRRRKMRTTT
jgi:hypothetical protein